MRYEALCYSTSQSAPSYLSTHITIVCGSDTFYVLEDGLLVLLFRTSWRPEPGVGTAAIGISSSLSLTQSVDENSRGYVLWTHRAQHYIRHEIIAVL